VRHGDLKPANVMLDAAGNAVLLDFGLATSSMTTTLHSRGGGFTPAYAAPEVQTGGARTAAADIFAFGLLLYEIWHGKPWYEGINLRGHASHVDFLRAGLTPPLSPPAMPAFMVSLITRCLATDASRRPSAVAVMKKFQAATVPSGAATRRADSLAEGDPTPFNPLPDGYTPRASAAAVFIALMGGDPAARVKQLVDAVQLKTRDVLHELGAARGQSEDEVFAIVAFTSDVRHVGLSVERNVWRRLNAVLRKRDLQGFAPFADYYWYLSQGLSKIPLEPPTVLWRGLNDITLEQLGPRYAVGRRVCFLNFTSTSAHKEVMMNFAANTSEAPSVMLRIEACEGRTLQPYSLGANEAEVLLAPNALCEVTVALGMDEVATLAAFPGGERLPQRAALVTLKQLPTPIPVIAVTTPPCSQVSAVATHTSGVRSMWEIRVVVAWTVFLCFATILTVAPAMHRRELYLEVIRRDWTIFNSYAYNNLANLLAAGESVTLLDGRAMNQRELYLEAIRHKGTNSIACNNLATLLAAGESVTLLDGRAMNQRELYLEAIRHDGTYSIAYSNLAGLLAAGESVTLPDGRAMNKRELVLEAFATTGLVPRRTTTWPS
jgi:hypothetical protein